MNSLTISHVGPIDDQFVNSIQRIIISQSNPLTHLTLQISSPGGSVIAGITAYNYLKSLPIDVHTHNLGEVSSAAILPYLAGNIRTAEDVSKFMFHPVEITLDGSLPFHKVEEILSNISTDISNYAEIIKKELPEFAEKHDIDNLLKHKSLVLLPADCRAWNLITD